MATVIFGSELQRFTAESQVEVEADTYRDLVAAVLARYPELPPEEIARMAVAINGEIIHDPMLEAVPADAEVHFLFRISGG